MSETNTIGDKEKEYIKILLAEYGSLRAEIIGRTTSGFQLVGAIGVVVTWLLSKLSDNAFSERPSAAFLVLLAMLAILFLSIYLWIGRLLKSEINKCSERIKEIEREVNFYAERTVLRWESFWSASATGWWASNPPLPYAKGDEPPQTPNQSGPRPLE